MEIVKIIGYLLCLLANYTMQFALITPRQQYMSPDRVEWFGKLGMGVVENWNAAQAESKGGGKTVDVMDMLSMTLSREDLAGREHWDKLYISHGIVSLEATNGGCFFFTYFFYLCFL